MFASVGDLQPGMDVLGSDGEKIGVINEVVVDPNATDSAGRFYFILHQGGVLGIGGNFLYIPVDAVQSVQSGFNVTLNAARSEVESRYRDRPS